MTISTNWLVALKFSKSPANTIFQECLVRVMIFS